MTVENTKIILCPRLLPGAFSCSFSKKHENANTNDRREEVFAKYYYRNFKLRLPNPDTIDDVILMLSTCKLEELKAHLVSNLFGKKLLRKFRLLGEFYFVAVYAPAHILLTKNIAYKA